MNIHPHSDNAARIELRFREFEELFCEKHRRTFDPGIKQIGRDRIELLWRRQQVVTSVVDYYLGFRISYHIEVVFPEMFRNNPRHQRLNLSDDELLNRRIDAHCAGGNASATANYQDLPGFLGR